MSKLAISRAQAAIDVYAQILESDSAPNVRVWHLLFDLVEWCDANGVDLDAELSAVRAEYVSQD